MTGRLPVIVAFAVCTAVLVVHAIDYIPFSADDSFISLRYAQRLLDGHGLTWTDGERVEGYSNFLWVLLVAFAGLPGQDLIATARVLGVLCAVCMLGAYFWVQRGRELGIALPAGLLSTLAISFSGPVAAHSVAGLEQPLLSALVVWGLACTLPLLDRDGPSFRAIALPGVLFGLASITRPDAPLIVAAVCVAFVFARGVHPRSLRVAAGLAFVAASFYLSQLAFRLGYYGEWIPNTALGKVSLTPKRLESGWRYLSGGLVPLSGLLIAFAVGVVGAVRDLRLRKQLAVIAAPIAVWCAFIVSVGGDHVPQRRHLFVAIGMGGLAASLIVGWLLQTYPRKRRFTIAVAIFLLAVMAVTNATSRDRRRAKRNQWFWAGQPVGLFLREAFETEQPLVAVDAAGALPYFSRLPSLDMLGLTDRHIAHTPPKTLGRGKLAHELGDGTYVLDREPDLVVFNTPRGGARPNWRSGKQMIRDPRFHREYRLVTFEIAGRRRLTSRMWIRLEGAVGVQRALGRVRVPGYLLSKGPTSRASLDQDGLLRLRVTQKHPARLARLSLEPGTWRVEPRASGGPLAVELRDARGSLLASAADRVFTLDEAGGVTIDAIATDVPVELTGIDLVKQ